jgi:predicted nucleic acid-binding protein
VIYLDTSALVKLVFEEPESNALVEWLDARDDLPKVSSELSVTELMRACRRYDAAALAQAQELLSGLDLLPIARDVVDAASLIDPVELRSLDAVHLASALSIKDGLTSFVAYDAKLKAAAVEAGLEVASPFPP